MQASRYDGAPRWLDRGVGLEIFHFSPRARRRVDG
jgi:hypothetical protein